MKPNMKIFDSMKLIMNFLLAGALCLAGPAISAATPDIQDDKTTVQKMEGDDIQITRDEVVDSIRYISAIPSATVCSVQIDIELKGDVVENVVYTRGCNGNAKGIGALIQGMKVDEAIRRLKGITCGKRPTSCPDQLARVLEKVTAEK